MKVSCEIIKDLLPLYHDNVCSAESRVLVEEHIKECRSCGKLLSAISDELARPANAIDEAKPIKAIQAVWKKDKAKSFFKGALISGLVCLILIGGIVGLTQWKEIPVSTELLEISEVCLLSDGRLIYRLSINDDKNLSRFKFTTSKDGSLYMIPQRSVIEGKQPSEIGSYLYLDVDIASERNGIAITSFYVGALNNGILIWEEGMELPVASEELEKMFLGGK